MMSEFYLKKLAQFGDNYLKPKNYFDPNAMIPWLTYPAIEFLKTVITPNSKIYEYGSGQGSLWYMNKTNFYRGAEHDEIFFNEFQFYHARDNIKLFTRNNDEPQDSNLWQDFVVSMPNIPTGPYVEWNISSGVENRGFQAYASSICATPGELYDVVIIDGVARHLCAICASWALDQRGFIVLDNSDRWQYNDILIFLNERGFGRIDFWGPGPKNSYEWCTSVFSKNFLINANPLSREIGSGDLDLSTPVITRVL